MLDKKQVGAEQRASFLERRKVQLDSGSLHGPGGRTGRCRTRRACG